MILRMRAAAFARCGEVLVAPLTLELNDGARLARTFATAREAEIAALMACGIVHASTGSVFIGEFDPRIQPTQCKRLATYAPHEAVTSEFSSFETFIEYRAALWGVEPALALTRARAILERLDGLHEAFAYPLAGALIGSPKLLVLDRPQAAYVDAILSAAGSCAVFSTHLVAREAAAFA
ncbi:MAG TPA: hypothetical protein VMS32_06820 [Verrucomicrobiae bacterium]|nr:hypothetical protein [Verrucomicrobiae bacterium]